MKIPLVRGRDRRWQLSIAAGAFVISYPAMAGLVLTVTIAIWLAVDDRSGGGRDHKNDDCEERQHRTGPAHGLSLPLAARSDAARLIACPRPDKVSGLLPGSDVGREAAHRVRRSGPAGLVAVAPRDEEPLAEVLSPAEDPGAQIDEILAIARAVNGTEHSVRDMGLLVSAIERPRKRTASAVGLRRLPSQAGQGSAAPSYHSFHQISSPVCSSASRASPRPRAWRSPTSPSTCQAWPNRRADD